MFLTRLLDVSCSILLVHVGFFSNQVFFVPTPNQSMSTALRLISRIICGFADAHLANLYSDHRIVPQLEIIFRLIVQLLFWPSHDAISPIWVLILKT